MNFKDFMKEGKVKHSAVDNELIKSIISATEQDLKFLATLKVTRESARKLVSNYYDALRSLLEASAIKAGYKIYSHEAFTFFLKEQEDDTSALKFDRLRKIRNKINYYGKDISTSESEDYVSEIKELISKIREKYLK